MASQRIISVKEHGGDASGVMEHKVNEDSLKSGESIITVDHLTREFKLPRKKEMFKAVDDVSFSVKKVPRWQLWASPVPASPRWPTWC